MQGLRRFCKPNWEVSMKRMLAGFAGLCLPVAVFAGVAIAGSGATTKSSYATIVHTCTDTGTGGGMSGDDADGDGDTITFSGPTVLWPPNHKYVNVTITATDVSNGTTEPTDPEGVSLMTTASSSQPALGLGSGNTPTDTAGAGTSSSSGESSSQVISLRAERDGVDPTKSGRTYTIDATAMFDTSGVLADACHATFTVHVPHDQGH